MNMTDLDKIFEESLKNRNVRVSKKECDLRLDLRDTFMDTMEKQNVSPDDILNETDLEEDDLDRLLVMNHSDVTLFKVVKLADFLGLSVDLDLEEE